MGPGMATLRTAVSVTARRAAFKAGKKHRHAFMRVMISEKS
jgi:hypothetical protein